MQPQQLVHGPQTLGKGATTAARFVHPNKCLLSTYHVPGTAPGPVATATIKTAHVTQRKVHNICNSERHEDSLREDTVAALCSEEIVTNPLALGIPSCNHLDQKTEPEREKKKKK